MFGNKDEYERATRYARINTYSQESRIGRKYIVWGLPLVVALGYASYLFISQSASSPKAVLGVSITAPNAQMDDEAYIKLLKSSEVDSVRELSNSMRLVAHESSIQSPPSSYMESISSELNRGKEKEQNYRVVVVKKGDTLSTLSKKYYGDSTMFQKILDANPHLNKQSYTLYAGKKIIIPN